MLQIPKTGVEPVRIATADFKPAASTSSAIQGSSVRQVGIEPTHRLGTSF